MLDSLISRLSWLFAALVVLAGTLIGVYAYHALSSQLEARDQATVTGKLAQVEHLLRKTSSYEMLHESRHRLDDMLRGHDGLGIRILSSSNVILYETVPPQQQASGTAGPHDSRASAPTAAVRAERVLFLGVQRLPATVLVVQSGTNRVAVLAQFRDSLIAGVIVSAALIAAAGWLLTRRELHETRRLVTQVNRIGVEQLSYRVHVPARPAEVRDIAVAFNAMLQRLEFGYERLYRFSADLAHDLRTPLANLIGHSEIALSKERNLAEYQAVLELSLGEYHRLSRMIEGMLFLARADTANIALGQEKIDLDLELGKIAEYFSVLSEDKNVTIKVLADGSLFADPMLFQRAVNNLMANAVEHCPTQGIITVRGFSSGPSTVVQVENPGSTISDVDLVRIFDRFYRGDAARSNSSHSTGLGLAIVRSVMELHGGTATASVIEDRLIRFELRFPHARDA